MPHQKNQRSSDGNRLYLRYLRIKNGLINSKVNQSILVEVMIKNLNFTYRDLILFQNVKRV